MRTAEQIIFDLIQSFPCLERKLRRWRPDSFDPDKFFSMMEGWSHGEWLCGLFVLNVWNHSYAKSKGWKFDVLDFVGTADQGNRSALIEWLRNPLWP